MSPEQIPWPFHGRLEAGSAFKVVNVIDSGVPLSGILIKVPVGRIGRRDHEDELRHLVGKIVSCHPNPDRTGWTVKLYDK